MSNSPKFASLRRRIAELEEELDEELAEELETADKEARSLKAQIDEMLSNIDGEEDAVSAKRKASIFDPDGVEERITQKSLSEMQRITRGAELTTDPSMLETRTDDGDVAPKERIKDNPPEVEKPTTASDDGDDDDDDGDDYDDESVEAKLREASFRLDRVAAYLERSGNIKLAYRIDRVADAVDAKLAQIKSGRR